MEGQRDTYNLGIVCFLVQSCWRWLSIKGSKGFRTASSTERKTHTRDPTRCTVYKGTEDGKKQPNKLGGIFVEEIIYGKKTIHRLHLCVPTSSWSRRTFIYFSNRKHPKGLFTLTATYNDKNAIQFQWEMGFKGDRGCWGWNRFAVEMWCEEAMQWQSRQRSSCTAIKQPIPTSSATLIYFLSESTQVSIYFVLRVFHRISQA